MARVTGEPVADGKCLVRSIVIHHQMNIQIIRNRCLDRAQEFQKLAAAMPPVQLSDDLSGGDIEGRKQRRCAMAHIVMRSPFGKSRRQRQDRLGAVERLYLALLIDAQHHRFHRGS